MKRDSNKAFKGKKEIENYEHGPKRARSLARIGRRPAEPVVRGSNPRGPAIYINYFSRILHSVASELLPGLCSHK